MARTRAWIVPVFLAALCCLGVALPLGAHAAYAQDDPDCVEPGLDIHKWTSGFVTNSSPYTLAVSMCYNHRGLIVPGGESPPERWDVEGLWSLNASGGGKHVYKLGWGNWHVYDSGDLLPGYAYLGGTAWCRQCGWLKKPRRGWNADVAPEYVLLVGKVMHCNASGGACVWAEPDARPLVALYDKPDYKIPLADATAVSRFEIAYPTKPESLRMQDGYHAFLYKTTGADAPRVCIEHGAPDLKTLRYPDGTRVGRHVEAVQVEQGECPAEQIAG